MTVLVLLLASLVSAAPLAADERGSARRYSPIKLRGSSTYQPPAGVPRHLVSPGGLGSAANVGPNFYRQLDAPKPQTGTPSGGGAAQHPGVVYVIPGGFHPYGLVSTPYAVGPVEVGVEPVPDPRRRSVEEALPPEHRESADQRPVVIINNPPEDSRDRPRFGTPVRRPSSPRPATPPTPKPTAPMSIELSILPREAEVYLDDELLGNGSQLASLEEPMHLDPGVYVVEVVHPGLAPQRIVFGVGSKPIEVIVDLEASTPGRRSRVRQ